MLNISSKYTFKFFAIAGSREVEREREGGGRETDRQTDRHRQTDRQRQTCQHSSLPALLPACLITCIYRFIFLPPSCLSVYLSAYLSFHTNHFKSLKFEITRRVFTHQTSCPQHTDVTGKRRTPCFSLARTSTDPARHLPPSDDHPRAEKPCPGRQCK